MEQETRPAVSERERIRLIVGVLMAMLLAAVDQASVAPAVAIIGRDLGDTAFLSWVVSAYFVTATAVTTLYGKVADLRGRRFSLFLAIGAFLAGSVVSAAAPDIATLVVGRAIQGLGGGGLLVLAMTVIGDVVPPAERGRYAAYISGAWAVASIAGPVMGGAIAEHLHWRVIFMVNLPLGLVALAICNRPLARLGWQRREHSLDIVGSVLAVATTVTLMLTLTWSGPTTGWASAQSLAMLAATAVLAGLFALRLSTAAEPLIPTGVLANRTVAAAAIGSFFVMGSYTGLSVYLPIFLQLVHGLSPSAAGLALIPFMAGAVLGSLISGRLMMHLVRYKLCAVVGVAAGTAGLVAMAMVAGYASLPVIETLLLVVGTGLGANFPITTVSVQNAVAVRDMGAATGVLQFLRSLGSALGIAMMGAAAAHAQIGVAIGARGSGGSATVAGATMDGAAFAPIYVLAALSAAAGLVCLMAIEDTPLRKR